MTDQPRIAIVGAGIAGLACARALVQAGRRPSLFEQQTTPGGRTASRPTPFGSFDAGAQYFTVRDPRLASLVQSQPALCKRWSANAVHAVDEHGRPSPAQTDHHEAHWVAAPTMQALAQSWWDALAKSVDGVLGCQVTGIEPDALQPSRWQLRTSGHDGGVHVYGGFSAVVLALPAPVVRSSLLSSPRAATLLAALADVRLAPCWTLMLAFPQAMQPGLQTLGPQWNAARSEHHRIAWLARESSKPGRDPIERWTIQASPAWSGEHRYDDASRVSAKLRKAFSEITAIHAQPSHEEALLWPWARTVQALGQSHFWDASAGLGACGDWCLGYRLEDAFVSGTAMAEALL